MKRYFVYILKCSDGTFYTGITSELDQRFEDHQSGKHKDSYTFSRRPVQLMFHAEFTDPSFAIEAEKQIKKWSSAKKKALINGQYELLSSLSKKQFRR